MNVEKLERVAEYIKEHPKAYNQGEWCGTACCIAGHAIALDGYKVRDGAQDYEAQAPGKRRYVPFDPWKLGAEVLGLTEKQAEELFSPSLLHEDDAYWYGNASEIALAAHDYIHAFIARERG